MSNGGLPTDTSTPTEAIDLIRRCGEQLGLSDSVVNNAEQLFKARNNDRKSHNPSSFDPMVAASVYSAMRVEGCGAPVGSVCSVLDVSETATMREVKRVQEAVDIDIPVGTPSMFVDHIIDELVEMMEDIDPDDVSSEVEDAKDITSSIAEELAETGYTSGYSNSGVAAAIVYGFGVITPWVESVPTQRQVADVAGVSDITIRNHYKNILDEIPIKEYVENHRGDFVNASGGERDQTASGEYEVERDNR